jgi:hypothetical protein
MSPWLPSLCYIEPDSTCVEVRRLKLRFGPLLTWEHRSRSLAGENTPLARMPHELRSGGQVLFSHESHCNYTAPQAPLVGGKEGRLELTSRPPPRRSFDDHLVIASGTGPCQPRDVESTRFSIRHPPINQPAPIPGEPNFPLWLGLPEITCRRTLS